MPLDKTLKKVIILGSGPIIIGQAAEFDYSGTQACKAIREEGIETILVNSNPATIMTDFQIADKVYIEPLTIPCLERIIEKEKPDGILAGFGGQTALNLAMEMGKLGILEKHNVKLLGINSEAIIKAEDRDEFKKLMIEIDEPIPESIIATNIEQCREFVNKTGLPIIIRPAYTLGGTGGGIAETLEEYEEICEMGLMMSPINQILLERSVAGWKELEYEVMRDAKDNCIIVCNMENIDPVGVHTGDSIVVVPSQTLRDTEYHMLRNSALKIIRSLKIEGGCNIQFALNPYSSEYIVIEVNPRVSRSSALASKAAGYPISKIAAKIAIGYSLDELKNYVTKNSSACFEPTLDYIVVKMPKWPFDKFTTAERKLGTQMKATGEVMAIDRNFESALLKAITCLEGNLIGLKLDKLSDLNEEELIAKIKKQDDERIFAIAEAIRRNITLEHIHQITKIDMWFLNGINNIVSVERRLKSKFVDDELIAEACSLGLTNEQISILSNISVDKIEIFRRLKNIYPVYKIVDTCSGEFEAETPYYYSCYDEEEENIISDKEKIMVIGSGPIRIGQGIEFDYSCVHGAWAIKEAGYESIMMNNNPETVSTDFDTADKLYFESLNIDDVMNVVYKENPKGVILQFGGQTSINLAEKLHNRGVNILGTGYEAIDLAENREKFRDLLESINVKSPSGEAVTSIEGAFKVVEKLGYPVLVRPSYVIGGRGMEVVYDDISLQRYISEAVNASTDQPILIDKYVQGTEIEVDCLCDGKDILIPGIMEHVERTGVHSGDSITVYPTMTLPEKVLDKLVEITEKIGKALNIIGLMNIQYVYDGKEIYVIEVNPRASRTVPILSKVTAVPMVKIAVDIMLGKSLEELGYGIGLLKGSKLYAAKFPVFSNEKLANVDTYLGPEMKSTGEVLGIDKDLDSAIYKGFLASGMKFNLEGSLYVAIKDVDKEEATHTIREFHEQGFNIFASKGTAEKLIEEKIPCEILDKEELFNNISQKQISLILNTPTKGNIVGTDGFMIRRKASENRIPVFTCIDTANLYLRTINFLKENKKIDFYALNSYF
jgi:carbamoyl-phosphate synthase large subunit